MFNLIRAIIGAKLSGQCGCIHMNETFNPLPVIKCCDRHRGYAFLVEREMHDISERDINVYRNKAVIKIVSRKNCQFCHRYL